MNNFNFYDATQFSKTFQDTDVYKKLIKNLPEDTKLHYDWYWHSSEGMGRDIDTEFKEGFPVSIFYYLNFILETPCERIYDIGCGQNMFKRLADDRIYGIDPCQDIFILRAKDLVDEIDLFDDKFVAKHHSAFDAAFAINSLHFIKYHELEQRIKDFVSCFKIGGRGLLCMNSARFNDDISGVELENYIRKVLDRIHNIKFLVVDVNVQLIENEFSNGNVRLVFERIN